MTERPPHTRHYFGRQHTHSLRRELSAVEGFNAKLAVLITRGVGTMACAYLFALLAFSSLPVILVQAGVAPKGLVPAMLQKPGLILIVAWIAQTFLQLVLLAVILVGQAVQSAASDARASQTYDDTEKIIDLLRTDTEGGLEVVLDAIESGTSPVIVNIGGLVSTEAVEQIKTAFAEHGGPAIR